MVYYFNAQSCRTGKSSSPSFLTILSSLFWHRMYWCEPSTIPTGLIGDTCSHIRYVLPVLLIAAIYYFGSPQACFACLSGKCRGCDCNLFGEVTVKLRDRFVGLIGTAGLTLVCVALFPHASAFAAAAGCSGQCKVDPGNARKCVIFNLYRLANE